MEFFDARQADPEQTVTADICIVGAGAAGIALAREFIGTPFRVALVESGDRVFRHRTQFLYKGENKGIANYPITHSRFRMFGGSTTRWGGQCRPLTPLDFERRDAIPHSGWPFDADHLQPYYDRAQTVCHLGTRDYAPDSWLDRTANRLSVPSESLETRIFQFSHPTDFGQTNCDALGAAANVEVWLNANVVKVDSCEPARSVSGIRAASFNGKQLTFKAQFFVLACGGIETPRLLLSSRDGNPKGLGNSHDLVGRFFMDHPYFLTGYFDPADPALSRNDFTIEDYDRVGSEQKALAALAVKESLLRDRGVNGAALYFERRPDYKTQPAYFSPPGRSFTHLMNIVTHSDVPDRHFWRHLRTVLLGIDTVGGNLYRQAKEKTKPCPRLGLRTILETTPNPDSRVTLTDRRDFFGMQRVSVDWRINSRDLEGADLLFELIRKEFSRLGLGRLVEDRALNTDGWPQSMTGGKHHMGTTRMHDDRKQGVVDPTCRLHETENLFIAGSSLFPTGGYVNPTLTIVALAIRLADHLKTKLAR